MDFEGGRDGGEFERTEFRREERSASPRGAPRRGDSPRRNRSISPAGARREDDRSAPPENRGEAREYTPSAQSASDKSQNPGTNLFVMGIHPRLTEEDITRLFSKYGDVVKCQIMVDPHTRESRSFGFVEMATLEQADSAKEGLQGEFFEGRTLSIQKAKRGRPRTPTPGKYFGPPKRDDYRRPPPRGYPSYDDRRGGSYRGGSRYEDDRYSSSRYDDRYSSNGGDRHYRSRDRDDYGSRGDRYTGGSDDRYRSRPPAGEDRPARGGGGGYYDRDRGSDRDAYPRGDDRGAPGAGAAGAPSEPARGAYYRDETARDSYRR